MSPAIAQNRSDAIAIILSILLNALLATGCASTPPAEAVVAASDPEPSSATRPAIRMGRYNLVEIGTDVSQRDLLEQVVEIDIPNSVTASVGDTLRYVLQRSGYRLCDSPEMTSVLDGLPLPAVHYHLGPVSLREALQVLVGPGWLLRTTPSERRACFVLAAPSAIQESKPEVRQ